MGECYIASLVAKEKTKNTYTLRKVKAIRSKWPGKKEYWYWLNNKYRIYERTVSVYREEKTKENEFIPHHTSDFYQITVFWKRSLWNPGIYRKSCPKFPDL